MKIKHPMLASLLKEDAKFIKKHFFTDKKNSEILNDLARFFGYRHFHELSKVNEKISNQNTLNDSPDITQTKKLFDKIEAYQFYISQFIKPENSPYFRTNLFKLHFTIIDLGFSKTEIIDFNKQILLIPNQSFINFLYETALEVLLDNNFMKESQYHKQYVSSSTAFINCIKELNKSNLNFDTIRESLALDRLIEKVSNSGSKKAKEYLDEYFYFLQPVKHEDGTLKEIVYERHGWLTMQISELFSHECLIPDEETKQITIEVDSLLKEQKNYKVFYPSHLDYYYKNIIKILTKVLN